jgi:hypothetical protein
MNWWERTIAAVYAVVLLIVASGYTNFREIASLLGDLLTFILIALLIVGAVRWVWLTARRRWVVARRERQADRRTDQRNSGPGLRRTAALNVRENRGALG